jgi:hypothetical protein
VFLTIENERRRVSILHNKKIVDFDGGKDSQMGLIKAAF